MRNMCADSRSPELKKLCLDQILSNTVDNASTGISASLGKNQDFQSSAVKNFKRMRPMSPQKNWQLRIGHI